ncbi:GTP-binding protein of the rab [Bulinus truncatus]|nr:GTP-binding protein of the rab [Bulinus truncatus]
MVKDLKDAKDIKSPTEFDHLFKVIIVGSENVGKTCFLQRFTNQTFTQNYLATIGVDFAVTHVITLDGQKVKLQLWDTAGQERYRTITNSYYRGAHGIIVMYDVQNKETFNELSYWLELVEQQSSPGRVLMVVGNKADGDDSNRQVSKEEAKSLSESKNLLFAESSAKNDLNIVSIFQKLTEMMVEVNQTNQKSINTRQGFGNKGEAITLKATDEHKKKKKCLI